MESTIELYIQAVLQREPEEGEVATWVSLVNSGTLTLSGVRQSIIDSEEAVNEVYPIIQAYQAIYGRVPDAEGLNYWVGVYRDNLDLNDPATPTINEAMVAVLGAFVDPDQTPEFAERYGTNPTAAQFVSAAYSNVLNRAPDQEGLGFWTNRFNEVLAEQDGNVLQTRAIILEQFVSSAEYAEIAAVAIDNFLDAAAQGEEGAYEGSLWSKDPDAPAPDQGQTFTLTAGIDEITGTANNDTFNAPLVANDVTDATDLTNSLTAGDILDGAGGTNRINVTLNDDASGFDAENIQNWFVRAVDTVTINMAGVDGAEQLWNDRSVTGETLTFNNVQNGAVLGLNDVRAGTTVLSYDAAITDPTSQTIAANGSRAQHNVNVNNAALTSATIAVTADTNIDLQAGFNDIRSLTLTGDADLTLTNTGNDFDDIRTVDATGLSTDLDLDISGQTTVAGAPRLQSVELGAGDNNLAIAFQQLAARATADDALSIDLGDGDNTLTVAGALDAGAINGLNFGATAGANLTINGAGTLAFTGIITVDAATATLTTDGIEPDALVFEAAVNAGAVNNTLVLDGFSGGSITFEAAVGGTLGLTAADVEGELTIALEDAAAFGTITLAEVTDLTIDATETGAGENGTIATLTAGNLETLTLNLGEGNLAITADLVMEGLTTITATGDDDAGTLTFQVGAGVEDLATIDLSGFEGTAVIDNSNADDLGQALTINIGEGNLTYTANGGSSREIFQFVGDDIGTVTIAGDSFTAGVGGNADRLDFSQFAGVVDIDDLNLVFEAGPDQTVITSSAFEGTITVTGVDLTTDAANFIF